MMNAQLPVQPIFYVARSNDGDPYVQLVCPLPPDTDRADTLGVIDSVIEWLQEVRKDYLRVHLQ
jgi:hypothetical protein